MARAKDFNRDLSWDDSRNPKIKKETLTTHPSLSLVIEAEK